MLLQKQIWLFIAGLFMFSHAIAHHSRSAFNLDDTIILEGNVTEVAWTNPHYYLSLQVDHHSGPKEWVFEGHSIPGLVRYGWRKDSIQVGQRVSVVAHPNVNDAVNFGLLTSVRRADGEVFYSFRKKDTQRERKPTPATDFSGIWRVDRSLRDNLVGGFGPPTDWPLTSAAKAELAMYSPNDDPSLRCEPRGLPRMLSWPYAQRWQRDNFGILIEREHSQEGRRIFEQTAENNDDGQKHLTNPDESSVSGYSQGQRLENGTYKIVTTNFKATKWGADRGISSSELKQLVEYYTLGADGLSMQLTFTLADPKVLIAPIQGRLSYTKVADYDFAGEPPCDVDTAQRHLMFED